MSRAAAMLLTVALLSPGLLVVAMASGVGAQMEDFPPHPGGRVELRRVSSGPLEEADIGPVLATLPARLRRCAVARARREDAMAAGFDFVLEVGADGRARAVGLDPSDDTTPHERAWLACARRVMRSLRFPAMDAPSVLRVSLIWMRDDVPHGDGLL